MLFTRSSILVAGISALQVSAHYVFPELIVCFIRVLWSFDMNGFSKMLGQWSQDSGLGQCPYDGQPLH